MDDQFWMQQALEQAKLAEAANEVPIGAILVADGEVIGRGYNRPISLNDPSAHAEMQCIRDACLQQQNYRLTGATMYVTVEPCLMCAGAIVHARISEVVIGARETKSGAVLSHLSVFDQLQLNHKVRYREGILAAECHSLMQKFFANRRKQNTKKCCS